MTLTYQERVDMRRMLKRVVGGTPTKMPEAYHARTPLFRVNEISCPVLIIHGAQDDNVPIVHAKRLEAALKVAHKSYETWYKEQYTHYFPVAANRQVVADACDWMKQQEG